MPRHRHRVSTNLAALIDHELVRAYRSLGLTGSPRRARPPAPPRPRAKTSLSPELRAYCRRFPTVPAWLDPDALVFGIDPSRLPCMADAEDGEQPWHVAPLAFTGPPDPPTTND